MSDVYRQPDASQLQQQLDAAKRENDKLKQKLKRKGTTVKFFHYHWPIMLGIVGFLLAATGITQACRNSGPTGDCYLEPWDGTIKLKQEVDWSGDEVIATTTPDRISDLKDIADKFGCTLVDPR